MTRQLPLRSLRLRGVALTLIAASVWPLHVFAVNLFRIVRPERIVAIVLLAWGLGMLLVLVLVACRVEVRAAETTSFVALLLVMNGGSIVGALGMLGVLFIIVFVGLAGYVAARMGRNWLLDSVVWGVATFLIAGPLLTLGDSWSDGSGRSVINHGHRPSIELEARPDIFLVVLDGYPGSLAAEMDGLGDGLVDFDRELAALGFDVPKSSWSAYWTTTLSVPSLLEMNYPVAGPGWRSLESELDLRAILSGDNAAFETLRENGYRTHMIESGWSAAKCGSAIDHCVPSPLIDEATYLILNRTLARSLLDGHPGPYVAGAMAGFDWLTNNAGSLARSEEPDFVFMHMVSPHPPLFLRADCSVEVTPNRAGTQLSVPNVPPSERSRYLTEHMDCLESQLIDLAKDIDSDDVVIFVSDHGTDRRGQADPELVDWEHDTILERMNNFTAIRAPHGCDVGNEVVVPNVLRIVLACLAAQPFELIEERMWVNPTSELEPAVVRQLLDMRVSS